MPRRFYVPQPLAVPELRLTGSEAHHLANVLRMEAGETAWVFDGQGHEACVQIVSVSSEGATLRVLESRPAQTETKFPLILGTAVPKGERFRWLVEKATEIGVARFVPLNTRRSIVDPGAGKLSKVQQTIVEASKQCGRSRLMELGDTADWKSFVATEFTGRTAYIAHPSGDIFDFSSCAPNGPVVLAIGPEGGFTDEEVAIGCAAGAKLLSLGPRILRIETAAVAITTLFAIGCGSAD